MKKTLLIFIILLIASSSYANRSVTGFTSFDQYREVGDSRLWTFIAKDSTIGTYMSIVKEQIDLNGNLGYAIEQRLKLDFTKISTNLKFDIINRHIVANDGMYLSDKMKITINDQSEEVSLQRKDKTLNGYITRHGSQVEQKINLGNIRFAVENNYIDQLELFLASQNLEVGIQIDDTIFMPQSQIESQIFATVEDFRNIRLYNEVFDSAFVIEFTYPTMMTAYFTPDKRLAKLVVPSQELKIYQDAVANPLKTKLAAQKAAESTNKKIAIKSPPKSLTKILFAWLIYIIIAIAVAFFFVKSFYKNSFAYLALFIGGGLFVCIPFTQIPLQEYLFSEYFVPHVIKAGESPLQWGILPALSAGLIQELLIIAALFMLLHKLEIKKHNYVAFGAILGAGFGIVEAAYLAYGTPATYLVGMNLVERLFLIIFHVSAGAFLSYSITKSYKDISIFVLITIIVNSSFRYMPIFAQNKTLTPELLGILLAFVSIAFLASTVYLTKKETH